MEIRVRKVKAVVAIDRGRMMDLMAAMDGTNTHEAFGMLGLALSLLYRRGLREEGMTMLEFTDKLRMQVNGMVSNPPEGFTDQDFEDAEEPTPGCNCDRCEAIRERQKEREASVH